MLQKKDTQNMLLIRLQEKNMQEDFRKYLMKMNVKHKKIAHGQVNGITNKD